MGSGQTKPPHLLMLGALRAALAGEKHPDLDESWLEWAGRVLEHLRHASPKQGLDPELILSIAACALQSIMCSENWRFLLRDALERPGVFARTLLLLAQGQGVSPLKQKNPATLH